MTVNIGPGSPERDSLWFFAPLAAAWAAESGEVMLLETTTGVSSPLSVPHAADVTKLSC